MRTLNGPQRTDRITRWRSYAIILGLCLAGTGAPAAWGAPGKVPMGGATVPQPGVGRILAAVKGYVASPMGVKLLEIVPALSGVRDLSPDNAADLKVMDAFRSLPPDLVTLMETAQSDAQHRELAGKFKTAYPQVAAAAAADVAAGLAETAQRVQWGTLSIEEMERELAGYARHALYGEDVVKHARKALELVRRSLQAQRSAVETARLLHGGLSGQEPGVVANADTAAGKRPSEWSLQPARKRASELRAEAAHARTQAYYETEFAQVAEHILAVLGISADEIVGKRLVLKRQHFWDRYFLYDYDQQWYIWTTNKVYDVRVAKSTSRSDDKAKLDQEVREGDLSLPADAFVSSSEVDAAVAAREQRQSQLQAQKRQAEGWAHVLSALRDKGISVGAIVDIKLLKDYRYGDFPTATGKYFYDQAWRVTSGMKTYRVRVAKIRYDSSGEIELSESVAEMEKSG